LKVHQLINHTMGHPKPPPPPPPPAICSLNMQKTVQQEMMAILVITD
jgi:hypothetical protein